MIRNRTESSTIPFSHYCSVIINAVHLKSICAITWSGYSISMKVIFIWTDYKPYVKTFQCISTGPENCEM